MRAYLANLDVMDWGSKTSRGEVSTMKRFEMKGQLMIEQM